MNNWKNYTVNIGHVKQRTTKLVKFESKLEVNIQHISPSCPGCTKFIDYKDNVLTLRYESPEFPKHLSQEKESIIKKYITVYYEDGSREQLNFVGFLTK